MNDRIRTIAPITYDPDVIDGHPNPARILEWLSAEGAPTRARYLWDERRWTRGGPLRADDVRAHWAGDMTVGALAGPMSQAVVITVTRRGRVDRGPALDRTLAWAGALADDLAVDPMVVLSPWRGADVWIAADRPARSEWLADWTLAYALARGLPLDGAETHPSRSKTPVILPGGPKQRFLDWRTGALLNPQRGDDIAEFDQRLDGAVVRLQRMYDVVPESALG